MKRWTVSIQLYRLGPDNNWVWRSMIPYPIYTDFEAHMPEEVAQYIETFQNFVELGDEYRVQVWESGCEQHYRVTYECPRGHQAFREYPLKTDVIANSVMCANPVCGSPEGRCIVEMRPVARERRSSKPVYVGPSTISTAH